VHSQSTALKADQSSAVATSPLINCSAVPLKCAANAHAQHNLLPLVLSQRLL
jgi:hypothetical protein